MAERKKRMDLKIDEKELLIKRIKLAGSAREKFDSIAAEWNAEFPDRKIDATQITRLSKTIPEISTADEFWGSVSDRVESSIVQHGAEKKYTPPEGGLDYSQNPTLALDHKKVPMISKDQLDSLRFDPSLEKYNGPNKAASAKLFRSDIRTHLHSKGMIYGTFSSFIPHNDKPILDAKTTEFGQDSWEPSNMGPWKIVGDQVRTNKAFRTDFTRKHKSTFSAPNLRQDRINPHFIHIRDYFSGDLGVTNALLLILYVCETFYKAVADFLPKWDMDSKRRKYDIVTRMIPDWFSMLTCLTKYTDVQREHIDDRDPGVGALWGLTHGQYVIVWLWTYEMNLELEMISQFYDFVMAKKPPHWSDTAFWNLVAGIHLENKGFSTTKRPSPVKVPLEIGHVLIFDFLVVHCGMPFTDPNLRGHMYWPKVGERDGDSAQDYTNFIWDSGYHLFYPGWRFISQDRRRFE